MPGADQLAEIRAEQEAEVRAYREKLQEVAGWLEQLGACERDAGPMNGDEGAASLLTEIEALLNEYHYVCPRCKGELQDLRTSLFSIQHMEDAGVCYRWAKDKFTCNRPPARRRALMEAVPNG